MPKFLDVHSLKGLDEEALPSKEAVAKHHEKHGFKCDWITEVKTTTT